MRLSRRPEPRPNITLRKVRRAVAGYSSASKCGLPFQWKPPCSGHKDTEVILLPLFFNVLPAKSCLLNRNSELFPLYPELHSYFPANRSNCTSCLFIYPAHRLTGCTGSDLPSFTRLQHWYTYFCLSVIFVVYSETHSVTFTNFFLVLNSHSNRSRADCSPLKSRSDLGSFL